MLALRTGNFLRAALAVVSQVHVDGSNISLQVIKEQVALRRALLAPCDVGGVREMNGMQNVIKDKVRVDFRSLSRQFSKRNEAPAKPLSRLTIKFL